MRLRKRLFPWQVSSLKASLMRTPDWGNLVLGDGILCEPAREGNRMVFWLPVSRDQEFQYWERIGTVPRAEIKVEHAPGPPHAPHPVGGTVPRAEIKVEHGICTTPATS